MTDLALIPYADYQATANQVRTLCGTQGAIKSGDMPGLVADANDEVTAQTAKIQTLIAQANSLPDASGDSARWVEIGTSLQQEMYKFGDVNLDSYVNVNDVTYLMRIVAGLEVETPLNLVMGDLDFDGVLSEADGTLRSNVEAGLVELPFAYATAYAYEAAKPGDYVQAVFQTVIEAQSEDTEDMTVTIPTYARVVQAGLIGIYSNVKIPLTATGSIKILKSIVGGGDE